MTPNQSNQQTNPQAITHSHDQGVRGPRNPRGLLKIKLRQTGEGVEPKKQLSRSPKLSGRNDISFSTCVKSLTNVSISRRGLLNLELAVGLAVFMDFGVANRAAKQMVADVYSRAGYDCEVKEGTDYKTVNRRINASAALFGKLTPDTLAKWVEGTKENKLLQAIGHKLTEFNFNSMDDVLDHCGRTSNRTAHVEQGPFDITVGDGVIVRLPRKLTEAQLIELASKIMALAEEVKVSQAIEAGAEPRDGGFVERRVRSVEVSEERRGQTLH